MEDKHRASFIHVRFYRFIVYRFIVFHYIFSLFISTNASKTINKHDLKVIPLKLLLNLLIENVIVNTSKYIYWIVERSFYLNILINIYHCVLLCIVLRTRSTCIAE